MLDKVIRFILLLPFELLDQFISPFVYPQQGKKADPVPDHALKKMRRMEGTIRFQKDQVQFLFHEMEELKRKHQREMQEQQARYASRIRALERQNDSERMRKGGQH